MVGVDDRSKEPVVGDEQRTRLNFSRFHLLMTKVQESVKFRLQEGCVSMNWWRAWSSFFQAIANGVRSVMLSGNFGSSTISPGSRPAHRSW